MLNAGFHLLKIKRILIIGPTSITHGDARLTDTSNSFFDQSLVPRVERLVATNEQSCRFSAIENGANSRGNSVCPIVGRAICHDSDIVVHRRFEQVVRILEPAGLYSVEPHDEWLTRSGEGGTRLRCRANEVGYGDVAGSDYSVTEPPHTTGLFDTIGC